MSKVTTGLIGIFAIVVVAAGIGYALFSSSATVTGLSVSTATPGLLISADDSTYASTLDASALLFAPLLPGESDWGEFWLRNSSDGTTDPLDFAMTAKLESAAGDWPGLKNVVKLRFCVYDVAADLHCDPAMKTAWYTLDEWYLAYMALPADLAQGDTTHYAVNLMIPDTFDNSVAGMTVSDIVFEFMGTQILLP